MSEQQTDTATDKKINLIITTPRGVKFNEQADMIIMRGIDGNLGVLKGHAPVSTVLGDGSLSIHNDGAEKKIAIFGGIVEIENKTVRIFSTIAQKPDEIDLERAEQDRREAEAELEKTSELQIQGLQVKLRRSFVRIEVSLQLDDLDDEDDQDNT